jgi:thiamine biosynthesis lipoprotein
MGTRFEIVLDGADPGALRAAGEEALAEIDDCDRRLSRFRSDSLLAHLHRATDWVALDADTFALFATCAAVHECSGGAFDPTVAPLMDALGFFGEGSDLSRAREAVGWGEVELDADTQSVRLARPDLRLDLGAIGKGHGLDLAARVLREAGVTRALLHGGTSTAIVIGAPSGAVGWRVAIGSETDAPVVTLCDCALAVSASDGRSSANGAGHVLDPRTATPATTRRAAVIADSATLADAWATALLVTGPDREPRPDVEAIAVGAGATDWQPCGARTTHRFTFLQTRETV